MGFFSNLCAVSKQSIPADCVEPCEVTAFFPDGTTETGIYDGYGRIEGVDIRERLRDFFAVTTHEPDFVVSCHREKAKYHDTEIWKVKTAKGSTYLFDVINVTPPTGSSKADIQNNLLALFEEEKKVKEQVTRSANNNVIFEFIESKIKMVKTKYVTPDMTYANLPVSEHCPDQGYFYGKGKPWDKPAYKKPKAATKKGAK